MVVCRFFQQGTCRFGPKCHNEHFDVKQCLKADMEACLNSNMWKFSVYGPFKDKPNVPNFIEDQSFEEVRLQAYESRRLNCFEQFHQQYANQLLDATNKMKTMLQASPQIVDMVIKLYDTPDSAATSAAKNNNNPFGQVNSIFSKPALGNSTNNLFGGATTQTSFGAAAAPVNNIFGGSTVAANNAGGSIFGGAAVTTNIFGQQPQQQPQPFGQQQMNPFGQAQGVPQAAQPSIFGQAQPQQQQTNLFGQAQAPSVFGNTGGNIFGQSQPANPSPFGQTNAFMQQPQPQAGGIFAQAAAATAPNTGNIFAQAMQQQQQLQQQPQAQLQQQPPNGFFGQAAAASGFQQAPQQQQMLQVAAVPLQLQQQQQQQQQQQLPPMNHATNIYSRMEDLTQEEIAAFKAEQFAPGQVPLNPPPRELC